MTGEVLTFSQLLKERRKALDLMQEDLAERVGCSVWTIRKLETGDRRPSRQVAELLADALRVPADQRPAFMHLARTGSGAGELAVQAPKADAPQAPNNLPASPTPLIGRKADVGKARARLLADGVRLLTLVGPPGIGKTRLALEVAGELLDEFGDGVFFVPLAPVSAPPLVASTIAQVLGLKETGDELAEARLIQHLQHAKTLLVLDNFEQVVRAANLVGDLLARCPDLKVLVTSREALRLRGERQFNVPPLEIPREGQLPALETLAGYAAVQLFVERAQAVSNFRLTEENAGTVAAICARLDGLPLAIELVAARSKLLPPKAILSRLTRSEGRTSLYLAAGGARDLPPRHQTLLAAIEWSYDLLEAGEQKLFARLGVFVGGSTIAAAEAVCNARGDLPVDVLEGVESLLDKSLVRQGGQEKEDISLDWEPRFEMLETIREYAKERLEGSGEAEQIRYWHAEYYLALAETAEPELAGPGQREWLDRLEHEHDNLRAALQWSLGQAQDNSLNDSGERAEIALRLCAALGRFWEMHSHLSEGRKWMDLALERGAAASPAARARALSGAGTLARYQGDFDRARLLFDESLTLRQALGDKKGIAASLNNLGTIAWNMGDYATARQLFGDSLTVRQELGDKQAIAASLSNLAAVSRHLGARDEARRFQEESLSLMRELGNKRGIATALNNLGGVAWGEGNYAKARLLFEESLALERELGHKSGIADGLCNLGEVLTAQGEYAPAHQLQVESLKLRQELGDKWGYAFSLEGFARLAYREGEAWRAAQLYGAAQALRQAISCPLSPSAQAKQDLIVNDLRSQLGEVDFNAAWDLGQAMPVEEVVAFALQGRVGQRADRARLAMSADA
ncbi:MAG: tetratricopeptide repeat protein [Chloroflexota bacterium]|nr:tetratricopeptide repeat protein [Chloroflexota bacterium]